MYNRRAYLRCKARQAEASGDLERARELRADADSLALSPAAESDAASRVD